MQVRKNIAGTWEYEQYSGYPFTNTFLPPGNGNIIIIGENGNFERRKQDTVIFKATYSLQKKQDCYSSGNEVLFTTSENSTGSYIKIENGKLSFSTPACYADGGTTFYLKIR